MGLIRVEGAVGAKPAKTIAVESQGVAMVLYVVPAGRQFKGTLFSTSAQRSAYINDQTLYVQDGTPVQIELAENTEVRSNGYITLIGVER